MQQFVFVTLRTVHKAHELHRWWPTGDYRHEEPMKGDPG
jgi:hypothetical protein